MILEIVSFERPEGFDDAALREDARGVAEHWRADPRLVRKLFARDAATGEVRGVYLWPDRAAAEAAHDAAWIARFEARTGRTPSFSYFDVFMEIDNVAGTVREYPMQD